MQTMAAAKAAAKNVSSEPIVNTPAQLPVAGAKRKAAGVAAAASSSSSAQPSRVTRVSAPVVTTPPPAAGGDGQSQAPMTATSASSSSPPVVGEYDPVAAGVIPSNLLFGHFGVLGHDALEAVGKMTRPKLIDLAVTLGLYPDVDAIPTKLAVPTLRQIILTTTGSAAKFEYDAGSHDLSFPDGVTLERPVFREPTA